MHRIGATPEFGIPQAETGIFVSSVSYTPEVETYEQKDHTGKVCGVVLHGQKVSFEMSGEVPYAEGGSSNAASFTMGATITLNNTCPASCWLGGTAPIATTSVITGAPITLNREGAREITVSGVIYPFGQAAA